MPSKNSSTSSNYTFTIRAEAIVLGQEIIIEGGKKKENEKNSLSISGTFDPPLDLLSFVLQQFGFEKGDKPIDISEGTAIERIQAEISQHSFVLKANEKLSFQSFKPSDGSDSGPMSFSYRLGESGQLTIPSQLPVIGDQLNNPDTFLIELSEVVIATGDIPNEDGSGNHYQKGLQIIGRVKFFEFEEKIHLYLFRPSEKPQEKKSEQTMPVARGLTATAPASSDSTKWIDVQKTLGPLTLRKIGFRFQDGKIWFLLNLSFKLGGFDLSLFGFRLGFPPKLPPTPPPLPAVGLDGISLSFTKGLVKISGAFLKAPDRDNYYSGLALIQTSKLAIDAFGGYGDLPENQGKAIFIFASVNIPIGGPPFFFVTGFSLGFGYNTAFKIPEVEEVTHLPLLNPSAFKDIEDPNEALAALNEFIFPEKENLWFAVGVQFTSFKLIDSKALLVVDIEKDQISLLGVSELILPKSGKAFINVRLGLVAFVKLKEGIFQARAKIASGSYLLDPNCKVFGDFAFFAWFTGPHKGDFVLSVGGYHPSFNKPAHYPSVDRVGFHWQVSSYISLQGKVYFALTPSAIMAGLRLEASYRLRALKAWFVAVADFVLQWKPFFFDTRVSIQVGASYRIFSLETGARLHLFGPPVSGSVHISWHVISFSILFGAEKKPTIPAVDWLQFQASFLPEEDQVCRTNIVAGLSRSVKKQEEGEKIWIVRADELILSTETVIPIYELRINRGLPIQLSEPVEEIGIRPMNLHVISKSSHDIDIYKVSDKEELVVGDWEQSITKSKVPEALWATTPAPNNLESKTLPGVLGLNHLRLKPRIQPNIDITLIENFSAINIPSPRLPLTKTTESIDFETRTYAKPISRISASLGQNEITSKRLEIIEAVNDWLNVPEQHQIKDNLNQFRLEMEASFQSQPSIGRLNRVTNGSVAKLDTLSTKRAVITRGIDTLPGEKLKETSVPLASSLVNLYQNKEYLFQRREGQSLTLEIISGENNPKNNAIQLITFSAAGQAISFQLLTGQSERIGLPTNVHHFSLSGLPPIDLEEMMYGWTENQRLRWANQRTFLGKQILVQPQTPIFKITNTPIRMMDVLRQNRYQTVEEKDFLGWIDTLIFAEHPQQIVLLLQQKSDALYSESVLKVSIPYVFQKENGSRQYIYHELESSHPLQPLGAYERIRFDLPTDQLPDGWNGLCVRVKIKEAYQDQWHLGGLLSLHSKKKMEENQWLAPKLVVEAETRRFISGAGVPTVKIPPTFTLSSQ